MVLLQALFSFLGKSAGKIVTAIFGWAVVALFGRPSPKEKTLLSALVGMAAAWPILVVGVAFPRVATFIVALVPLSDHVPESALRIVWLALALLIPIVVGSVVAAKAPPGAPREGFLKRMLRGFPITMGIAIAFVLMFVTVPVLRVLSAAKGRRDEHVPCIAGGNDYEAVARCVDELLTSNGIAAQRAKPSWWLAGPAAVLKKLGGKALRGFMPEQLAYWTGPEIELAFYPSDMLIRSKPALAVRVHGLLAEALAHQPCRQTFDPNAQELERQIRQVWRVYQEDPVSHQGARGLRARIADIGKELSTLPVDYDDWQIVYRQTLQLARAIEGQAQLFEMATTSEEASMGQEPKPLKDEPDIAARSTGDLIAQLTRDATELVKKQVELAETELRADMKLEVKAAVGLGLAGFCGYATFIVLIIAGILAMAETLPAWLAALIVAGALAIVSVGVGLFGWLKRVKKPLDATQRSLKEDVHWAKERLLS